MSKTPKVLRPPIEVLYSKELKALEKSDSHPKPPGWKLSPRAVRAFVCGSSNPKISRKFYGDDVMIERAIVGLAGNRGLLLVGEPGTAKTMLSELLSAAISGISINTIQGSAGTSEDQIKYSWNYAMLLAKGPSQEALVPAPLYVGMREGILVRFEEITRCPPEIQDALISVLSDKVMSIPELSGEERTLLAKPGFNVIATANIRDRGVHEMSSALKRRFNFETIHPIRDHKMEVQLVTEQARMLLDESEAPANIPPEVIEILVSAFQELREGMSAEGVKLDKPGSVMSTAEAVSIAVSAGLDAFYYGKGKIEPEHIGRHIASAVMKDNPDDLKKLKQYFQVVVRDRSQTIGGIWSEFYKSRKYF